MNVHLDPVKPWSRLWDIAQELSGPLCFLGVLAAILAFFLPVAAKFTRLASPD